MPMPGDYVTDSAPEIVVHEEKGTIVFFRESAFVGSGITYFIQEDTQNIGVLKSGTYFVYAVEPGKHTYSAETEARSSVTLDVQPGEIYYIEGSVAMGFWAGRPQLTEVTRPVAEKILPTLQYLRIATLEEKAAYEKEQEEIRRRDADR